MDTIVFQRMMIFGLNF